MNSGHGFVPRSGEPVRATPAALGALSYVGARARDLAEWRDYGTRMLGMQVIDRSRKTIAFRMDDRCQRLVVCDEVGSPDAFYGWEVQDATAMDGIGAAVERTGIKVTRGSRALADERFVADLIVFNDPAGNRLEVVHGAHVTQEQFVPGRVMSGFRTGSLGMGHVVLMVQDLDTVERFYREVLGFRMSDLCKRPFEACFLHINARHHSLALVKTPKQGIHHLMVETYSLDDVGQGYDLFQATPEKVGVTLGRHNNDCMTSFYSRTPSDFMVEYGWGGRCIDPESWQSRELPYGTSLWGHERYWLDAPARQVARELREQAAAAGEREAVQVMPGNYALGVGACPWWDRLTGQSI